ncbi:extracellular solute-binding protein [Paenibacillus nasutitermitis]|uniref:Extracellular solute-binding protein n=1 Tax=Paenibacillus nasutitermitis TaxID=1652958 RepID=A0A917DNP4_9BACL|nr:extracellular solute-binding protein [Paenibacillus nasutitermitis]GGD56244.1 hypothetical protein GCM10010911_12470 [Paenibacillus nasutitermitis]
MRSYTRFWHYADFDWNNDGWMTLAALYAITLTTAYKAVPDFDKKLNAGEMTFADGWRAAAEMWFALKEKGYLTYKSTGISLYQAMRTFATGNAAMYIDGNWSLSGILAANPKIQVAMMPLPANKPASLSLHVQQSVLHGRLTRTPGRSMQPNVIWPFGRKRMYSGYGPGASNPS